jgi:hypothetical protein
MTQLSCHARLRIVAALLVIQYSFADRHFLILIG